MNRYKPGDTVICKRPLNCKGTVQASYETNRGVEMIVVELEGGATADFPEADRPYFVHTLAFNADDVVESGTTAKDWRIPQ